MVHMNETAVFRSDQGKRLILDVYDQILERWPVPLETLTVPTRLGETHLIACGEQGAQPLFLLHGSTSNATMWIGDAAEYAREYRVYAVDIPGEPGKSCPVRPDLRESAYADWLSDVFRELGVFKAGVVGNSLGGFIALKFASAYPQLVRKLVLLCPAGVAAQKSSFMLLVLVLMPFGGWGHKRLMRIISHKQDLPEEAISYFRLMGKNFNPRRETIPLLSDAELAALRMPVLLIAGEKDALLPSKATASRLETLLPDLTVDLLPDTGHVLIGFERGVMEFLVS